MPAGLIRSGQGLNNPKKCNEKSIKLLGTSKLL
jgi:hypothetical protein